MMEDFSYLEPTIRVNIGSVELILPEITYKCSLTGDVKDIVDGANIMKQLKSLSGPEWLELKDKEEFGYRKVFNKLKNKNSIEWNLRDPGNFSFIDTTRAKKKLKCYSYDINSAYSYAMLQPMPDTRIKPKLYSIVGKNEIGFNNSGYATTEEGSYAEYIFPLIESPFKKYVDTYYNRKAKAADKVERNKWKQYLNIASGLLHRHNIFLRLAVLYYASTYIAQFIDEDTVYCNTDSIISVKKRTDIPLGTEIGKFKEEHINEDFKYIDVGIYQWGNKCHYTGIPGCTLTDITDTTNWKDHFPYRYDEELRRIVKNEQAQK